MKEVGEDLYFVLINGELHYFVNKEDSLKAAKMYGVEAMKLGFHKMAYESFEEFINVNEI